MQKARMVNMRAYFFGSKDRSLRQLLQGVHNSHVGAAEGCDLLLLIQNNPSLSGNSYSDTAVLKLPGLPGLPSVGSFSMHSTR